MDKDQIEKLVVNFSDHRNENHKQHYDLIEDIC